MSDTTTAGADTATDEARTVVQHGSYEVIGPVRLPLAIEDGSSHFFSAHYFGFPTGQYTVLLLGDLTGLTWPLLRVQSRCIWGIEFGSQYCDCRWQLEEAKRRIVAEEKGVIIYCHDHSGKAVGLRNHHLVYAEGQRRKLELVVDAYESLGFQEDYRSYSDIGAILRHFRVPAVRVLTNSPRRIDYFRSAGFDVERVAIEEPLNPFLEEEYTAKLRKLGHLLHLAP